MTNWAPFFTLLEKEVQRMLKVKGQTVITPTINATLYLLIFGVSLGKSITLKSGVSYLFFIVPGLVMMAALNNAYQNTASTIINSKFHGDLMDLRVVPLSNQMIVWALSLGALVRGFVVGLFTLLISLLFSYFSMGSLISIAHPILFLVFITVGSLTFGMLGIAIGFHATSFEKVNAVSSFVLLPLMYLGGVFFSTEQLHPFWQGVSRLNPMLYLINGVRYSTIEVSDVPLEASLGIAFFSFAVMFMISSYFVKNGSYSRW